MALLRGRVATEARVALADLSASCMRLRPTKVRDPSLASGLAGLALVHTALDPAIPEAGHRARAEQLLGRALERLSQEPLGAGLHSGLAGVGWTVAHLVESDADDPDHPCAAFDGALAEVLDGPSWTGPYDLIEGL